MPRNHHRPPLHASHTVGAIFGRQTLEQIIKIISRRLLDHAFDGYRPRLCLKFARVFGWVRAIGAKFIIVVVGGRILVWRDLFCCVEGLSCCNCRRKERHLHEVATIVVHAFRSNFRRQNIRCTLDQHFVKPQLWGVNSTATFIRTFTGLPSLIAGLNRHSLRALMAISSNCQSSERMTRMTCGMPFSAITASSTTEPSGVGDVMFGG